MAEPPVTMSRMLALSPSEVSVLSVVAENPGMSAAQFERLTDGTSVLFLPLVRAVRAAARGEAFDPSLRETVEGILRSVRENRDRRPPTARAS